MNGHPSGVTAAPRSAERDASLGPGVSLAVVDPDEIVRAALREHVEGLGVPVAGFDSIFSLDRNVSRHGPLAVLLGPSLSPQVVVERIESLLKARPDFGAIMLAHPLSPQMVRAAFRAGVDDVITTDAADTELLSAVRRCATRLGAQSTTTTPPVSASGASMPAVHRRVVTVFGAKGGVGKSVVAVNLAVAIARHTSQPTVIVDANLQFGDAAIMLQLPPAHTITEAALAGDRLDAELLDNLLLRHDPTGIRLLAAPPSPEAADQIRRSDLASVIGALRERYTYVVIDTSPRIEECTLAALEASNDILLLTSLDVTSLKDARLALQTFDALGIAQNKVSLVLNRANAQGGLTRADAGRSLRMKVTTALPSDPAVADSVNRGMPMALSAPTSKFSLAVDDLARLLAIRSSATST